MTFSNDLRRFAVKLNTRSRDVFIGVTIGVHESITEGSTVTGSPGQPVDTGTLKGDWQYTYPAQWESLVSTVMDYAPGIEEGVGPHGPITQRSEVGGFHSVFQTRANFDRLVDDVTRKVAGNG